MFKTPIVMLDFETTGLSPNSGARITEVAALRLEHGQVVDRFVSLVNCKVRIPSEITALTGITQSMVNAAPTSSVVIPQLLKFIGNDALAAHNASFDAKFLLAESARLNLASTYSHLLCTVKLSRRVFPGMASYRLSSLAGDLGIRFKSAAHRAEADAEVSAKLLLHIGKHLQDSYGFKSLDVKWLETLGKMSAAKGPAFLQAKVGMEHAQ